MSWNPAELPGQYGRVVVITGGNAGLGYFAAEQLAATGARIVLASRSEKKADAAMASIRERVPSADLGFLHVDLSSLASATAAGEQLAAFPRLDGLVLNAGLTTGSSERQTTEDGYELTFATNYIGHFALTALAASALLRTPGSRVVGLGSIATRLVDVEVTDLQSEDRYAFFRAYAFSKHAIHGLVFELDRRLRAAGAPVSAILAHPGFALDGLSLRRPGIVTPTPWQRALAAVAQGKNRGAAPIVRALLDPDARGGDFYGPQHVLKGVPRKAVAVASSAAPDFGAQLFRRSEMWTGLSLPELRA
jgi:NAD(P)-dependent dehydrogenase (short-subunit alcohol dehydrogenase family)